MKYWISTAKWLDVAQQDFVNVDVRQGRLLKERCQVFWRGGDS